MIQHLQAILKKKSRLAVGLMSGTSLDGIDAALVEIKGSGTNTIVELIAFHTEPYAANERQNILKLCSPTTSSVDEICRMNVYLGQKFAKAARNVIQKAGYESKDIDFISSHGQTIYHMPEQQATLQIGELAVIAEETGILTVGDFRPNDMAVGGQGAPLVPFVDYLLFNSKEKGRILVNIGGISNLTGIPAKANGEDIIAFDTGPGNVLIDAIVKIGTDGKMTYDKSGLIAQKGTVSKDWLKRLVERDPYLSRKPPKSTGRELYTLEFAEQLWEEGVQQGLSFNDIVATISEYTVHAIVYNIKHFLDPIYITEEVLVGGGGIHNTYLMGQLQANLSQKVGSMEAINFSSDAKEAIAFAILGNEFLHGNTNNLPSATGATHHVPMGKLVLPSRKGGNQSES